MAKKKGKKRPGGEPAKRPLHFIWLIDCSGSMQGSKIQTLNQAIKDSIPEMKKIADQNPNAQILIRAIKFSYTAEWHIPDPVPVEQFQWQDMTADGTTAMGEALSLVADALKPEKIGKRALPPVLVLLSDGQPTDDFKGGLNRLLSEPWGKKAIKIAIAIGDDADKEKLREFVDNPEYPVLEAKNAPALVNYIRWVSTKVLDSASKGRTPQKEEMSAEGAIPVPKPASEKKEKSEEEDVW